jgi:gliding motility-associated-like protein
VNFFSNPVNVSTASAVVNASPIQNITYVVTVTNANGCTNKDSINVNVIHPFNMQTETAASICSGQSITLVVSGADTYKWINNTVGLSSTSIANPVTTPVTTTIYTVTGTDSYKCFTDTSDITITVASLPVTDAGTGAVILSGTSYQLQSTSSPDVVKWNWSPPDYLSCDNCSSPHATPSQSEIYTLMVTNAAGCIASDTVSVKLFCSASRIFIPTAFTPNGDGLNELFSIKGDGISAIHYFRIYDRWGTLVFEHNNFQVGDKSGSWDGRYKGVLVSQGLYVYFAELSCGEQTYVQKGSVTVLY